VAGRRGCGVVRPAAMAALCGGSAREEFGLEEIEVCRGNFGIPNKLTAY
jgi:hypothetical protein